MKHRSALLVLSVAACLSGPSAARAGDVPADVKEAIAYFDKYAAKSKDDTKYAELVHDLAATGAAAAAERIGKILTEDRNLEHQMIAADALSEFAKDGEGRAAAGKALVKALQKGDWDEDMQIQLVDALGKIAFAPGTLPVCEVLLKAESPWLMLRCVRALGLIKDLHALPALLEILERMPVGYKWPAGEEVKVDSGAAGDADQKEAERQYNEQNSGRGKKGKPPVMFKAYIQELKKTVQAITNDPTIDGGQALRAWMVARTDMLKKLGIEIPKYKGPPLPDEDKKKK
jgi:HEAT repeats